MSEAMSALTAPDGYELHKCLHETAHGHVYAGLRERDDREVVIKAYQSSKGRQADETRLQREVEALRAVAGPGVPAVLDVRVGHNPPLLVLARAPGVALGHWCLGQPEIPPAGSVRVAAQLARVLVRVHERHLIHRDILPDNILVDPATLEAHLVDFGLARPLGAVTDPQSSTASGQSCDTLRYLAPEQTGRMNRGCDFRSDLYSLGCVFYLMLTGRPPFEADDALELVHSHIARLPARPAELRSEIPEPLSKLVLKLLSKEPEARYQSARSLLADLETLRDQLEGSGRIDPGFVLGSSDAPERPRFSRQLVGREVERAQLERAYSASARGALRVVLIEGESGVGKSSLVDGLRSAVVESGGYLVRSKFDLYRDRAYAGWATVVESLVHQILIESDKRLEGWRQELLAGLGNIARALVELAPDLALVIGDVPPVPGLGPGETRARLSLALQRFIAAAATPAHPLVLFLDDLQSCDPGSRMLLEDLLSAGPQAALLLIGAYRTGLVGSANPSAALQQRLVEREVEVELIPMGPLPGAAVRGMLAEALERPLDAVASLAETIERKTGNSPLLVQQFIEHIHQSGLLHHEAGRGWTWDSARIAAADIPDGAVAMMTARLENLEPDVREVLQLASCVGDEFDVELLGSLGRRERVQLEQALYALCEVGLIAVCANGFRFVHDRIRETARALLSERARAQLHAEIAQLLLDRLSHAEQTERVFEIVEHLNRGRSRVPAEQRLRMVGLNVLAGKRALASGAGAAAVGYFGVARELFREDDWSSHRELVIDLFLESAESAFQSRELAAALELLDALEARPLTRVELARAAATRLRILPLLKPAEVCVRTMLGVLRRFGVRWPLHPSRLRVRIALRFTGWMLALRGTRRFLEPTAEGHSERVAPVLVIAASGPSLVLHDVHLAALAAAHSLRWYLRFGHLDSASYRFSSYVSYSYLLLGNVEAARRNARMLLEWNERFPNPIFGPRAEHVMCTVLHPWLMRRREALAQMSRIADEIRETGDPEFFQYARFTTILYLGLAGDAVAHVERRLREHTASIPRLRPWHAPSDCMHRTFRRLLAARGAEADLVRDLEESRSLLAGYQPYASTVWMLVLCVLGRHELAFAESERIAERLLRICPFVHVADHTFYRGGLRCRARDSRTRRGAPSLRGGAAPEPETVARLGAGRSGLRAYGPAARGRGRAPTWPERGRTRAVRACGRARAAPGVRAPCGACS
jgi:hypothetical protein